MSVKLFVASVVLLTSIVPRAMIATSTDVVLTESTPVTDTVKPFITDTKARADFDQDVLAPLRSAQQKAAEEAARLEAERAEAARVAEANALAAKIASHNAKYGNGYTWGNCTWWVASQRGVPTGWGNARNWAYNAQASGWTVSRTPVVGAIAQTSAGWAGHVALVIGVGNGTVTVSEMNVYGLGVVDTQTYPVGNFIYLY